MTATTAPVDFSRLTEAKVAELAMAHAQPNDIVAMKAFIDSLPGYIQREDASFHPEYVVVDALLSNDKVDLACESLPAGRVEDIEGLPLPDVGSCAGSWAMVQ